jgi:hypothetical protein
MSNPRRAYPLLLLALVVGAGAPLAARTTSPPCGRRGVADRPSPTRARSPHRVAPGTYAGGLAFGVAGAGPAVVLEAEDAAHPPVFRGGTNGFQFTDAAWLELRGLVFEGATGNGLNLDDGGTPDTPAHHVVLRDLVVRDVGPDGNRDGIKLSGLLDFRVEGCTVERWGRGGSAVDMVGCQRGLIEGNTFRHEPGADQASGVQGKGATRDVTIRRNRFEHAGSRAVNAGGSTGLAFFRPPLEAWKGPKFEAKDLVVEGNTFVGSATPVAFVGVDGAVFRFNTVYLPGRWALRVLQETREPGFVPAGQGRDRQRFAFRLTAGPRAASTSVGHGARVVLLRAQRVVVRGRAARRASCASRSGGRRRLRQDPGFRDAERGDLRVWRDGPRRASRRAAEVTRAADGPRRRTVPGHTGREARPGTSAARRGAPAGPPSSTFAL